MKDNAQIFQETEKLIQNGLSVKEACAKTGCPRHVYHYRKYGKGKNNLPKEKRKYTNE